MSHPEPSIRVNVDVTNPGQFFACCGLLELADRLWPGAEGWFGDGYFVIQGTGGLAALVDALESASLQQLDCDDDMASPLHLGTPFGLRLDWWVNPSLNGSPLKVWAGSMRGARIARAMKHAIAQIESLDDLLTFAVVVYDPDQFRKKVEPFYFDGRRGSNAQSIDVGFAPDSVSMKTVACPALELLCLVGLQRFRPATTDTRRVFEYATWSTPLPPAAAASAVCGASQPGAGRVYRFENAFRTDQRKHKSFLPASHIGDFS
jgi:CRISPR-associated protein Csb3